MQLHAKTKQEYISGIEELHGQGKQSECFDLICEAFEDHHDAEDFNAWCCGFLYAGDFEQAPTIQRVFMERFPLTLFPVKVDYAESQVRSGSIDDGSNEARSWLALLHEKKMEESMQQSEMIADAAGRAFLLTSAVYTEMAARSYSIRLLKFAVSLPLDDFWKEQLGLEINKLNAERSSGLAQKADGKWEAFFQSGAGAQDLVIACRARKFDLLEKRVALLFEIFQERANFVCDEEEFFQLVYRTEQGAFVLV